MYWWHNLIVLSITVRARADCLLREALRVATRGIQQACVPLPVDKTNGLAVGFRENKAEIDHLRQQLDVVRRPIRLLCVGHCFF